MILAKLTSHLETKHERCKNKSIDFFKEKSELKAQKTLIRNTRTENELALKVPIFIALCKIKKIYHHRKRLNYALYGGCQPLLRDNTVRKIKRIPLSIDTVSNRITMMSDDIYQKLLRKMKRSKIYALQLYESTDITDKTLLLI